MGGGESWDPAVPAFGPARHGPGEIRQECFHFLLGARLTVCSFVSVVGDVDCHLHHFPAGNGNSTPQLRYKGIKGLCCCIDGGGWRAPFTRTPIAFWQTILDNHYQLGRSDPVRIRGGLARLTSPNLSQRRTRSGVLVP